MSEATELFTLDSDSDRDKHADDASHRRVAEDAAPRSSINDRGIVSLFAAGADDSDAGGESPTTSARRRTVTPSPVKSSQGSSQLTPRSRVRRLIASSSDNEDDVPNKTFPKRTVPDEDSDGSAQRHEDEDPVIPRRKSGLAALLRRRREREGRHKEVVRTDDDDKGDSDNEGDTRTVIATNYAAVRTKLLFGALTAKNTTPSTSAEQNAATSDRDDTESTPVAKMPSSPALAVKSHRDVLARKKKHRNKHSSKSKSKSQTLEPKKTFASKEFIASGESESDYESPPPPSPKPKKSSSESSSESSSGSGTENPVSARTKKTLTRKTLTKRVRATMKKTTTPSSSSDSSDESENPFTSSIHDSDSGLSNDEAGNIKDLLNDKNFVQGAREQRNARIEAEKQRKAATKKRRKEERRRKRLEKELEEQLLLEEEEERHRKPRKASKKALEEMSREQARIERNRQLALEPVTLGKTSKESVFSLFNFTMSNDKGFVAPETSSSQPRENISSESDPVSTPPSSPSSSSGSRSENNIQQTRASPVPEMVSQPFSIIDEDITDDDMNSDFDANLPDMLTDLANSLREDVEAKREEEVAKEASERVRAEAATERAKAEAAIVAISKKRQSLLPRTPAALPMQDRAVLQVLRTKLPEDTLSLIRTVRTKSEKFVDKNKQTNAATTILISDDERSISSDSSGDDLEVLSPGKMARIALPPRVKVTLENVRAGQRRAMPAWKQFALPPTTSEIPNPSSLSNSTNRPKKAMTDRELEDLLESRIQEQSMMEKESRQAEIIAKGGKILTGEEKKKEDQIIEELLERERKHAAETRLRERRERIRRGELEEEDGLDDDSGEEVDNGGDADGEEDEFDEADLEEFMDEDEISEHDEDEDNDESAEQTDVDNDEVASPTKTPASVGAGLTQFFGGSAEKLLATAERDRGLAALRDNNTPMLEVNTPGGSYQMAPMRKSQGPSSTFATISQFDAHGDDDDATPSKKTITPDTLNSPPPSSSSSFLVDLDHSKKPHYSSPEATPHTHSLKSRDLKVTSFAKMMRAQRIAEKRMKKLKKSKKMKEMFDEHAEESEDEWAGIEGGHDDDEDDEDDDDLDGIVDDPELLKMVNDANDELENRGRVQARYAADEREKDDRLVHDIIRGVHGGFRRKRASGGLYDLSDSDNENLYEADRRRQRRDAKRRKYLLKDKNVSTLAENPKAAAFYRTIEEDERKIEEPRYVSIEELEEMLME
ncbi:MRC1-like domain-containing protein [Limtongia smithiae]|uniref:MRC1-like domain-containing protein n=1 Tax=Limtongia smithiae TaxID=1125753 RepID=UPI0034CDE1BE